MGIPTFLIAWLVSVLAMTAFSSIIAYLTKREVREHVLLAQLLNTLSFPNKKGVPGLAKGWVVHFAMGLVFLLLYEALWAITGLERNFLWAFLFGIGMGILGIIGWMVMFGLHPNPPKLHFTTFYIQLLFAHIILGIAALGVYLYS